MKEEIMLIFRKLGYALVLALFLLATFTGLTLASGTPIIKDALGHDMEWDGKIERVLCTGPGCLRLLTYLQAQDLITGVEDIEKRDIPIDPRPYFLANPSFRNMPQAGEFRGLTRPELVVSLEQVPQVIFKTFPEMGIPAARLQEATGIPVITLEYGNLINQKDRFYTSLRIMARVIGKEARAESVVSFIEENLADLAGRMKAFPESSRKTAYVGGIAYKGPHGLRSTEKGYPPFTFTGTKNVAFGGEDLRGPSSQADVSREKILEWDPEVIFIDLSTLNAPDGASAIEELRNDPLWRGLRAVRSGKIYGLLPYNWYSQNFGNILADAYFIGKVLYPECFEDIDPEARADEIFTFLVGRGVFQEMKDSFEGMAFERLELE